MKRAVFVTCVALLSLLLVSCATPVDKAERLFEQYIEAREKGDDETAKQLLKEYEDLREELNDEELKELDERLWKVLH